uniref:RNA-directed DNA polymerase, eukaryota, reverse transcriptase zinc-binding domain protein n=1 Tax=Heterorhabditis bacteriophora TaxID=37862 RepID=A0A1I7XSI6_HETBA
MDNTERKVKEEMGGLDDNQDEDTNWNGSRSDGSPFTIILHGKLMRVLVRNGILTSEKRTATG